MKSATKLEERRLLDVRQVAELLGVSSRQVYRLTDGGALPRPLRLGGSVRWDRDAIDRWIAAGCPRSGEQEGKR
jgi:prophage regulatory protein